MTDEMRDYISRSLAYGIHVIALADFMSRRFNISSEYALRLLNEYFTERQTDERNAAAISDESGLVQ